MEGVEIFKKPINSSSQMYKLSRNSKPINNPSKNKTVLNFGMKSKAKEKQEHAEKL